MSKPSYLMLLPVTALLFSACGGSSGGGEATDLSSPTAVAKQVSNLVATTGAVNTSSGTAPKSLQDGECDSGSVSQSEEFGVNVDSPYTNQQFDLYGENFSNCRLNDTQSNDYLQINGVSQSGFVQEGNDYIDYLRLGSSNSSPFNMLFHTENGAGSSDAVFNINLVSHARDYGNGDYAESLFLMYDGTVSYAGLNVDFSVRLGASEAQADLFMLEETSSGLTINGKFAVDLDEVIDRELECSGSATIATQSPLVEGSATLYDAGELTLSNGVASATVVFNGSNNEVTITTSSGTTTLSQDDLASLSQDCAGIYSTGFGLVN